jgi:hypothetical protein
MLIISQTAGYHLHVDTKRSKKGKPWGIVERIKATNKVMKLKKFSQEPYVLLNNMRRFFYYPNYWSRAMRDRWMGPTHAAVTNVPGPQVYSFSF